MLAIAGTQRHPRIPDVPTMAEAGFPDVQMQQWFGLFAPAGTPAPIVQKLNAEFVKALQSDEVKNKMLPQVVFVIPTTPEELGAMVARDIVAARPGGEGFRRQGAGLAGGTMSLEYAPRGLVGMLTPQANTTVEPEFNLLWPPGVAMINARLMSDKPSMSDRLVDYFDNYGASLRQFANAPVGVVGAACTGASYLAGREREAAVVEDIAARSGHPFVTAALAVVDALTALKAQRLGLVSPYPDDLNRASVGYWQSHGFEVARDRQCVQQRKRVSSDLQSGRLGGGAGAAHA